MRCLLVLIFAGIFGVVAGDGCWNQIFLYMEHISNFTTMPLWAMQMLDSTTKFPEGILAGNMFNFGNFDECVRLRGIETTAGTFDGQYCMVAVNLELAAKTTSKELETVLRLYRTAKPKATSLQVSVAACVPSTCSSSDASMFVTMVWKQLLGVEVTATGNERDCQTADNPMQPSDWGVILILTAFATLVVISTLYDLLETEKDRRVPLMLSFSLYTNGKKLFDTSVGKDALESLNGIRFFSLSWIVLTHYYSVARVNFSNLAYFVEKEPYSWTRLYLTNGFLGVDSFFMLSGLLVTYLFCKTVFKTNRFDLLLFYVHRIVRLTPGLAIVVLVSTTVYRYVGSGPLWLYGFESMTMFCPSYWWATILYVNNYVHPQTQCLGHTWFLSVDMQLYWLSPLLLIPLWKRPRLGIWLGVAYCVASVVIPFVATYVDELGTNLVAMVLTGDAGSSDYYDKYYVATQCRFSPYIIGMLTGYFLYKLKTSTDLKLTKVQAILCWLLSFGLLLTALMSVHPMLQKDYAYNVVEASFYNALHRTSWALGLAIMIVLCSSGYGGFINAFLSWSFFVPLSRVAYGIYLLHPFLIVMEIYSARSPQYGADVFIIPGHFGALVTSTLSAIVFSLVFESPFINIERELLGKKKTKPNSTSLETKPAVSNDGLSSLKENGHEIPTTGKLEERKNKEEDEIVSVKVDSKED